MQKVCGVDGACADVVASVSDLATLVGVLIERVAAMEEVRAAGFERLGWLEAVAEGQSTLMEIRVIEMRGLAREMLRAVHGVR